MKILVLGKVDGKLAMAAKIARERGVEILECRSKDDALNALRGGSGVDLILMELGQDIAGLAKAIESERIATSIVCCGPPGATKEAVASIRAGAKEYLPLPPDEDMISAILEAAANKSNKLLAFDIKTQEVKKMAEKIATSTASVLITGQSGTGKEVIAHHIHQHSNRAKGRFVAINCAAIPETLLESELFGYERGAFTGAVARRLGKFEEANKGTLLLDEISEMTPSLQAKLLRVIQEKEVDRLGSGRPIKIDVRVLATTNRDLDEEVKKGTFRQDLFFRLNVVSIEMPPLKSRPSDIEGLAFHFVKKFAAEELTQKTISSEAIRKLCTYDWPGNVRELENILHRAVLISTGNIIESEDIIINSKHEEASQDVSLEASIAADSFVGRTVAEVERELIISTLGKCIGNRTHASNILGISIRTLRNKLKQYTDEGYELSNTNTVKG